MSTKKDARLVVMSFNAHVGLGIVFGALAWVIRSQTPDLIAVQEGRFWKKLSRALGAVYGRYPKKHKGKKLAQQAMNYVAWKKSRFDMLEGVNKNVRHGSVYPRRVVGVILRDKLTGRLIAFSSLHPDPLGAGFRRANPRARARHILQVKAYRAWHLAMEAKYGDDLVHLCVGDSNEVLTKDAHGRLSPALQKVSARGLLGDVGMKPLHDAVGGGHLNLDDVFFNGRGLKPQARKVLTPPRPFRRGLDHPITRGVFTLAA